MSNKMAIQGVTSNLNYIEEDVNAALSHAKDIKDPELTKKLNNIKSETEGVKDYLVARINPKQG
jgi:hypothetical protein